MPLPRVVARFNKRYTNRFLLPLAQRSSGFAVVEHIGRVSGKVRRTPVNVFWLDDDAIVALTYGPEADWVRNVMAAGGSLGVDAVDTRPIDAVELVGRDVAWPVLPWFVQLALRALTVHHFLRIKLRP